MGSARGAAEPKPAQHADARVAGLLEHHLALVAEAHVAVLAPGDLHLVGHARAQLDQVDVLADRHRRLQAHLGAGVVEVADGAAGGEGAIGLDHLATEQDPAPRRMPLVGAPFRKMLSLSVHRPRPVSEQPRWRTLPGATAK